MGFCLFSFSDFTFGLNGFHLKKLKMIQLIFELARDFWTSNGLEWSTKFEPFPDSLNFWKNS